MKSFTAPTLGRVIVFKASENLVYIVSNFCSW